MYWKGLNRQSNSKSPGLRNKQWVLCCWLCHTPPLSPMESHKISVPLLLGCKWWLWFTTSTQPIHLLWSQDVLQSRTNNELKEMPQETSMFLEVNTLFTSSLMTTWSYWKDTELSKKRYSGSCRSRNAFIWSKIRTTGRAIFSRHARGYSE